jgi:hypothetical protein
MVVQILLKLTDLQTSQLLKTDLFLQTALGIEPGSKEARVCPKTIWDMRYRITKHGLTDTIFNPATVKFLDEFSPDCKTLRADATHVNSNMKKMGRRELFFAVNRGFLKDLKKKNDKAGRVHYAFVSPEMRLRYGIEKRDVNVFSMSRQTGKAEFMDLMAEDAALMVGQWKDDDRVNKLESFPKMARVLDGQCEVSGGVWSRGCCRKKPEVSLKPGKEVPAVAMQNPSDPDATFSRNKGQGYNAFILENVPEDPAEGEAKGLSLILDARISGANVHGATFFKGALEVAGDLNLGVSTILADAAYGSQENYEQARRQGIELVSPVNRNTPQDKDTKGKPRKLTLDRFARDPDGSVTACPRGRKAAATSAESGGDCKVRAEFKHSVCSKCPKSGDCPVRITKSKATLAYGKRQMEIAVRRSEQDGPVFKEKYRIRSGVEGSVQRFKKGLCPFYDRVMCRGLKRMSHKLVPARLAENFIRVTRFKKRLALAKARASAKAGRVAA